MHPFILQRQISARYQLLFALVVFSKWLSNLPLQASEPEIKRRDSSVVVNWESFKPGDKDLTASSLRRYQNQLRKHYGNDDGKIPLEVKAAHFEWVIRKYHLSPRGVVYQTVTLPKQEGMPPEYAFGDDVTTWNGALLAALSYQYAVTKDQATLRLIDRLCDGLKFADEVNGQPGLVVRCLLPSRTPIDKAVRKYKTKEGEIFHYRSDAAKGTYNQLLCGYATMMMLVANDFSPQRRQQLRRNLARLVLHVIDHDYHLTEKSGKRTQFGNLMPLVGTQGIPFNAQVAYLIVATGHYFPPENKQLRVRIDRAFERLREKHHVYYEQPFSHAIKPQQVGKSNLVKGMNDRNHVLNAAYVSLMLDLDRVKRNGRPPDKKFLYQMGRSMYWTMEKIQDDRNALCNFMYAGLLQNNKTRSVILPHQHEIAKADWQLKSLVLTGVEQLRRYPLDRFKKKGYKEKTSQRQWVDTQKPHETYFWKAGPYSQFVVNGPASNRLNCCIDYLYAFWLMRYYKLYERYLHMPSRDSVRTSN